MITRIQIFIRGVVQGVGFRPFIYQSAQFLSLKGFVKNSVSGVTIEAEGEKELIEKFLISIREKKPTLSSIHSMEFSFLDPAGYNNFEVLESTLSGEVNALILPDIAVCDDCLNELFDKNNRRYLYPFINCTNCGPRYTIIKSLPYDRINTSMSSFEMCKCCRKEYEDPSDRRFHAQPIACSECGPSVKLLQKNGVILSEESKAISNVVELLKSGNIIALKGLGGYQLIADAANDYAVKLLRSRKQRERKPLAVMVKDSAMAGELCELNNFEKIILKSPEAPILISRKKSGGRIAQSVSPDNPYLGIMLPYTPLHHLIMKEMDNPVIATSGNISEEPMCINEYEAFNRLPDIADYFLIHNRGILRAVDDSVVRVVQGCEMMIRRARGYAPLPFQVINKNKACMIALGAHQKNNISLVKDDNIFVSQHLGDMESPETEETLKRTINDLSKIYDVDADYIIHDLHPGYTSTRIADDINIKKIGIQHHHAHAASCYYENKLHGNCLAVCWDGTGYGTDGTIWGGEFFQFNGKDFKHSAKLKQFRIPGGEKAARDIRRSAAGVFYLMYGEKVKNKIRRFPLQSDSEFYHLLDLTMKDINCFRTSSAGRLIDAVSWIMQLSNYSHFEGESAMRLEFSAESGITDFYPFDVLPGDMLEICWNPAVDKLMIDLREKVPAGIISAKFHNTLIRMIVTIVLMLNEKKVILSGGCFQNMYLLNGVIEKLRELKINTYWHQRVPTNDGGISFGQAALTCQREDLCV
jgi:hydrogenase maturation protein HypF